MNPFHWKNFLNWILLKIGQKMDLFIWNPMTETGLRQGYLKFEIFGFDAFFEMNFLDWIEMIDQSKSQVLTTWGKGANWSLLGRACGSMQLFLLVVFWVWSFFVCLWTVCFAPEYVAMIYSILLMEAVTLFLVDQIQAFAMPHSNPYLFCISFVRVLTRCFIPPTFPVQNWKERSESEARGQSLFLFGTYQGVAAVQ